MYKEEKNNILHMCMTIYDRISSKKSNIYICSFRHLKPKSVFEIQL